MLSIGRPSPHPLPSDGRGSRMCMESGMTIPFSIPSPKGDTDCSRRLSSERYHRITIQKDFPPQWGGSQTKQSTTVMVGKSSLPSLPWSPIHFQAPFLPLVLVPRLEAYCDDGCLTDFFRRSEELSISKSCTLIRARLNLEINFSSPFSEIIYSVFNFILVAFCD